GGVFRHAHIGRFRTAGPLTMVTAKNSRTRTPSASAMAIERLRRLLSCASVRTIPSCSCLSSIVVSMRPLPYDQRCNGADHGLDQQRREQSEQVKNGESKELFGRAERSRTLAADIDIDGEREHAGAEDQRGDAVDPVEITERPGRGRDRDHYDGVEQDLQPR